MWKSEASSRDGFTETLSVRKINALYTRRAALLYKVYYIYFIVHFIVYDSLLPQLLKSRKSLLPLLSSAFEPASRYKYETYFKCFVAQDDSSAKQVPQCHHAFSIDLRIVAYG